MALFVNSLRGGGSERLMVTLANGLAAESYAPDLVLGRAHGPYLSSVGPGVHIVDFNTRKASLGVLRLAGYLRRVKPPVMLSTNVMANVAAVFVKKVFRTGTGIVINEGSTLSASLDSHRTHPQAALRFAGRAAPWLYRRADAVVAVSKGAARELTDVFGIKPERVETIYNPAIVPELPALSLEEPPHPWFRQQAPVVLAVGRLHPAKDYPTLLRAFAALRIRERCRLLILGEGQERESLARLARKLGIGKDLDMPGFVENPFCYMRRAAVYVLSSAWEGLSNTLIEAMACGCPVVSTDCPNGPAEILDGGRYGDLVAPGDAEQLADAMHRVLRGCRKKVDTAWLQQFTVEAALRRYVRVLGLDRGRELGRPEERPKSAI